MVDEMTERPLGRVRGGRFRAFQTYNLKRNPRCRPAVGAEGHHLSDNHKSQDPQACIRIELAVPRTRRFATIR
jgi:hypothetical protein